MSCRVSPSKQFYPELFRYFEHFVTSEQNYKHTMENKLNNLRTTRKCLKLLQIKV